MNSFRSVGILIMALAVVCLLNFLASYVPTEHYINMMFPRLIFGRVTTQIIWDGAVPIILILSIGVGVIAPKYPVLFTTLGITIGHMSSLLGDFGNRGWPDPSAVVPTSEFLVVWSAITSAVMLLIRYGTKRTAKRKAGASTKTQSREEVWPPPPNNVTS